MTYKINRLGNEYILPAAPAPIITTRFGAIVFNVRGNCLRSKISKQGNEKWHRKSLFWPRWKDILLQVSRELFSKHEYRSGSAKKGCMR